MIRQRLAGVISAATDAATADPSRTIRATGTYIVYGAAVLASLGTLYELALQYAGWNAWTAPLFAIAVDIYWLTAFHAALDKSLTRRKRAGAAFHGLAAIAVSIWCNILYHELNAGIWHLGRGSGGLLTAGIGAATLLIGAALTHLHFLSRKEKVVRRTVARPAAATAPASRPSQPPQPSVQVEAEPPRPATPDRPGEPSQDGGPPHGEDATVPASGETEDLPRPLKAGGRPDPIAVAKAREIYTASLRAGQLMNRRTLQSAVNEHYGFAVIGETSADTVITEHRSKRTA